MYPIKMYHYPKFSTTFVTWIHPKEYLYMKSSFPKHVKRNYRKRPCNASANFEDCLLGKSFSYIYIYVVYMYIFMKSSFPKHNLQTLALTVQHRFLLDWRLTRIGKELFMHTSQESVQWPL